MSDYSDIEQECLLGFKIEEDKIKQEISPAIYESRPIYSQDTGQCIDEKTVIVKPAVYEYVYQHTTFPSFLKLYEKISLTNFPNNVYVYPFLNRGFIFIGTSLFLDRHRDGFIRDKISAKFLSDAIDLFKKTFPDQEIELHFFTS